MRGDNGRSDRQAQSDAVPCPMTLARAEAAERVLAGLGVAIGVGALAGVYPAVKAAHLTPAEALRTT